MKPSVALLIPTLSLTLSLAVPAVAGEACNEPAVAITGVRVFDGEAVIDKATVVTRCTTIRQVVTGDAPDLPADTRMIDGAGKTLLPGLIDTHTHTFSLPQLTRPLDFGVTTVMDMGSVNREFAGSMRAEREQGPARDRSDLYSAVLWVTAPGSHGTQFGEVPTLVEPEDADAFVAARVEEGADYIKIIYDNFKMFDQEVPTLRKETMQAVVKAAHARGLRAVVHARDLEAWADVADAGADGLVHPPVDAVPDAALIQQLKAQGIWVGSNLSMVRPLGETLIDDPAIGPMLTEAERANLGNFYPLHRPGGDQVAFDTLTALHAAGVTVLPNTDTPNRGTTPGASMHVELAMLVEAGFAPTDALGAATAQSAAAFGLTDRGRVAEGLQADLLLVDGAPDKNITDSRNIVAVIKAGRVHLREVAAE